MNVLIIFSIYEIRGSKRLRGSKKIVKNEDINGQSISGSNCRRDGPCFDGDHHLRSNLHQTVEMLITWNRSVLI